MTTETPRHSRLPLQSSGNGSSAGWPRPHWAIALAVLLAICLAALWLWSRASERRALLTMDPAQRRVLFEETRAGYRTMCGGPAVDGFAPRCRGQAEFLQNFPECDAACQAELAPSLSQPSR